MASNMSKAETEGNTSAYIRMLGEDLLQCSRSSSPAMNDTKSSPKLRRRKDDQELPDVKERLAQLRPSRELLEYYRKKISEFDSEHSEMLQKLDGYRATYEEQLKLQWQLRQREDEISELQKALSDMQVYLFQEREHVLRLYAENDRLKIRELEDRKKINKLLSISGLTESEVSYFLKEPPAVAVVQQQLPKKLQNELANKHNQNQLSSAAGLCWCKRLGKKERDAIVAGEQQYRHDNQTLSLQVEALQAQLEEQTRLSREQLEAMFEDRRVKQEESDARRQRDTDKIQVITKKLHKTQELLYDSTKDYLQQRYDHRNTERLWIHDKDRLLLELDQCRSQLNLTTDDVLRLSVADSHENLSEEVEVLTGEKRQAQKLADMYREQVIQLEDKLACIREEETVGKELFKARTHKMAKRLELMNQRYQDLERRRNLEVEGFKTDIRTLRQSQGHGETTVQGLTCDREEERPDDIDMQVLHNVRRTAGRSQQLMGELKTLKSKVYGLENDLRHL
ncbi:hypothetical protein NP493_3074g00001 [Ridgeia piscesae]|uniref:Coiled-coil domain-containing protein 77 n=1 Tax=Ridgeia piscesae TaxID=27915 RepID=A0AAD9MXI0_RIDPI|nr:hypothetical protein NP493_3074g00001 [Ridgeia piscesae]